MLEGTVHPDFAAVAVALERQIPRDQQAGSAVCVYHRGRPVVDVWGGVRNAAGDPWQSDTVAPSFSTTKGVLSTLLHRLVDEGRADYDDPIARYWPAFAANGKAGITLRQALTHRAGLYRIRALISDPHEMLDWPHMLAVMANATPVHTPGTAHGYHAITYGWLLGGVIEALAEAPLAEVLRTRLVEPLGLDGAFIGLPDDALPRRAELTRGISGPGSLRDRSGSGSTSRLSARAGALVARALRSIGVSFAEFDAALKPFTVRFDWNAPATVQASIPAANGQFTARSLARLYAMLAAGGELDGVRVLSAERVQVLSVVVSRSRDRVLQLPMHWRLGYHRAFSFGRQSASAFGHYGYGGSGGFCDPSRELAVALTLNSGAGTPMGNTNLPRIARAAFACVDRLPRTA
ncbi:MAG: serine hydrolase domain-containing protein [Gammaproteobacteria bacterium]